MNALFFDLQPTPSLTPTQQTLVAEWDRMEQKKFANIQFNDCSAETFLFWTNLSVLLGNKGEGVVVTFIAELFRLVFAVNPVRRRAITQRLSFDLYAASSTRHPTLSDIVVTDLERGAYLLLQVDKS
jgi:hypothetical protein